VKGDALDIVNTNEIIFYHFSSMTNCFLKTTVRN